MVRALWNGEVIAESDDTVIIDRNHYFPADSVDRRFIVASDTTTVCGWKGRASYYSLDVNGATRSDAAWYYPSTSTAARSIEGRVAFERGVKIEDEGTAGRRRLFDRFRRHDSHEDVAPGRSLESDNVNQVVRELDDDSFFAALDGSVTIADFGAPWCGPCTTLSPMFERVAHEHSGDALQFVSVDVDASPGISSAFNIASIPTIIVFDVHGNEVDREIGLPGRRRLEQLVRHARSHIDNMAPRGAA